MSKQKIIPDQVLESHTCRICDKYLTVGPISIHPDGGNVCGRCNNNAQACSKITPKKSLFECEAFEQEISIPYVIFGYANHLFPCINRFEGCNDLLNFPEISGHEKNCRGKLYQCGYCLNYYGTGSQLVNHFRKNHPFSFHDQQNFRFKLTENGLLLLKCENFLFFLQAQVVGSHRVELYLQSSKYIKNEVDFSCLLKSSEGIVIEQSVAFKKQSVDAIFQQIDVKQDINIDSILCNCCLRRTLNVV